MERSEFKAMWESMHKNGYFERHHHYHEVDPSAPDRINEEMDRALASLDYSSDDLNLPFPYSVELEKAVKRTEPVWLRKMFDIPGSGLAIDIGCGYGRSMRWLCASFERVIGFDVSASAIEKARKYLADCNNVDLFVSEPDQFPPGIGSNNADFIYAFTVFQHIPREYTARYVLNAADKLRPNGLLVFNLISGFNEGTDSGGFGVEWVIGYTRDGARALVERAGLSVERMTQWRAEGSQANWLWIAARK